MKRIYKLIRQKHFFGSNFPFLRILGFFEMDECVFWNGWITHPWKTFFRLIFKGFEGFCLKIFEKKLIWHIYHSNQRVLKWINNSFLKNIFSGHIFDFWGFWGVLFDFFWKIVNLTYIPFESACSKWKTCFRIKFSILGGFEGFYLKILGKK